MKKVLMPASGHPNDHEDSVHILREDGRVPCGRVFSSNIHKEVNQTLTCERCKQHLETNNQ